MIFAALNNTDINTSKNIRSINVAPHDYVRLNSTCTNGSSHRVGCVKHSFDSKQLDMADIYVTDLDGQSNKSYIYNFNFTLYHEIGHVDQLRNIGYDAFMTNSVQIAEQYADEYAYKHALSCNFSTYEDIIEKFNETKDKLNKLGKKMVKWGSGNYTVMTPEMEEDDKLYYVALAKEKELQEKNYYVIL